MGGAVDAVSDVVGGVGGAIGGLTNSIPGIGPYLGPVLTGALVNPAAGFKSLAFNAATGKYDGGGGSSGGSSAPRYAEPTYNYGANSYQMGGSPVDTSKYLITGDRGVYNLMPALGQVTPKTLQSSNPIYSDAFANSVANKTYYTPYEAYTDLSAQMKNDPKALTAFQSMYQPTTPTAKGVSPYVDFGLGSSIGNNATYGDIASYASTNQNPYFVPYSGKYGRASEFQRTLSPTEIFRQKQTENKARQATMTPEAIAAERAATLKAAQNFMSNIKSQGGLFSNIGNNAGNNRSGLLANNQTNSKSNTSKK